MSMDVQSCKECGRIFSASKPGVCSKCKKKEQEALVLVTDSLRDEPGQSVEELSENTGVEAEQIMKFIRDGRIASDSVVGTVPCGRCGEPAESMAVRLCPQCKVDLQKASAVLMNKPAADRLRADKPESEPGRQVSGKDTNDLGKVHQAVRGKRK